MAGKSNTLSKKSIIAIVSIIVLLLIAGISVGLFLADQGQTEAVDGNQTEQTGTDNQGDNNNEDPTTEPDSEGGNDGTDTNPTTPDEDENVEGTDNEQTTGTGVTTGTNVNDVGETTITRVEEQEKLVSEDFWDWWAPINVAVASTTANINAENPELVVNKTVITETTGDENLTYAGQELTYIITVENKGSKDIENIEVTDKIPQNTTFVSINDEEESEIKGTTITKLVDEKEVVAGVKWVATIPAGEKVEFSFTVKVNEKMIVDGKEVPVTGTILNTAIANGEESNEGEPTKTSIITNNKSSVITRNGEVVETAKLGDRITYTITISNTGDAEGTTFITDTIPAGTKLISIQEQEVTENQTNIAWSVKLAANTTITREFVVEVVSVDGKIKNIANVGGEPTNEDENETADITVIKEVIDIKRAGVSVGKDAEVKEGDVIEYKITVKNNGSKNLTNVVVDEKMANIQLNEEELQIGDLVAGASKEIYASYTVTYIDDIKNKENTPITNEVYVSGETTPDPEIVEDDDKEETPVAPDPRVKVEKSSEKATGIKAGETVYYTIKVSNIGNVVLENIAVSDKLTGTDKNGNTVEVTLPIYEDKECTQVITEIAKLEVTGDNSVKTVYAKYVVTQDDVDNQVQYNNIATSMDTPSNPVPTTPEQPAPAVKVEKVAEKSEGLKAGETAHYTITVTNTGNVTLENIPVSDTLTVKDKTGETVVRTENLTLYENYNAETKEYSNLVTTIAKLEVIGEGNVSSKTLYAKYVVTQKDVDDQVKFENIATSMDTPSDPVPTTPEEDKPAVEVEKVAEKSEGLKAGETVHYTITVTNTGNVTLENIPVSDTLTVKDKTGETVVRTENLTLYENYNAETKEYSNPVTTIAKLEVIGEGNVSSKTLYAKYTVTQKDVDDQVKFENIATSMDTPSDPVPTTPEELEPAVTIEKSATAVNGEEITDTTKVRPGDVIEYTIIVDNTGNKTLTNIEITDELEVKYEGEVKPANTVITTIDSLAPTDEPVEIKLYYTVTEKDCATLQVIANVATATAEDGTTDEDDDITVQVNVDTSVSVTKVWVDANNQDGKRPETITINLYADGKYVKSETISGTSYTFTKLPTYNAEGGVIVYTVSENEVKEYTTSYSQDTLTITNTHTPETTDIAISKVWDDANNQDGIRPESVSVTLYANGVAKQTVTVTEANNWAASIEDLPVYENGTKIEYTLVETPVDGYETSIDGFVVTNSHTPAVKDVTVNKVWEDANNQDGIRPTSVTLILKADGTEVDRITVDADDSWTHTFTNLPVNANGKEIVYTVDEAEVATGYEKLLSGLTVTNSHTPAVKDVTVNKVWDDASNQDGIRPETVTLILKADGTEVARQTVNAEQDNEWAYTFNNLPVNANGKEIVYTVDEAEVATGYEKSLSGLTVTNSHTPAVKDVTVNKVWDDANNQDGIRPETVTLILKADGTEVDRITVDADDNWTHTFKNLPVNANGKEIVYTVDEAEVATGYEKSLSGLTVTNSHTPAVKDVTVNKVWDDANNQDGIRPTTVNLTLYANKVEITTVTVSSTTNWSHTFTNLPVNVNGTEIEYTVDEKEVATGYEKLLSGLTVTNSHTPAIKDVTVNKVWDDNNNQDGIRATEVSVSLKNGENVVDTVTLSATNNWTHTFTNLPVNENGNVINYTVVEDTAVPGYEATVDGFTITNSHVTDTTSVTANKVWDDANDQDGIRPETITLILKANGTEVARKAVTATDNWSHTFTDLPVNANGTPITYTVDEAETVEGYVKTLNGLTVTNSHTPAVKDVTVNKVWDDASNQDGIRPETVTLILKADGTEVARQTVNAEQDNDWAYTFKNLPVNANGKEIVYTVDEAEVATGYEKSLSGLTVTNSHTPAVKDVTVNKVWDDASNQDGIRPTSVNLTLYANKAEITTVTVSSATNWSYTFKNLPVNVDGTEIEYTVDEKEVATGYEKLLSGLTVTNSHTPAVKDVTVNKVWDDANNQDGIRPTSVTLILKADGTEVTRQTVNAEQDNDWAYTFTNLPVNANGKEIVYTVDEAEVATGYEKSLSGLTVTNSHTPAVKDVTVNKVWDDANNQDGIRPTSVTLILKANGTEVARQTVNAEQDNDWAYTFNNLPVNANGEAIVYTVDEADVATGYEKLLSGLTVTNKHNVEKTSVTVTKSWDDANNQDGIRPTSVSVTLKANGVAVEGKTVTLDSTNGWTYTFADLNKKSAGVEIEYTVVENNVRTGYSATVTGDAAKGYTITNKHEVEKTSVTVTKVWSDGENQDGLRTDSVSVSLKAGSEVVDTQTLSAANSWTYTFSNLDKKSAGTDIVYTVVENNVPSGYEAVVTTDTSVTNGYGFIVTNSHTPEVISIPVTKVWEDHNNHYGARKTVTVDAKVGDTVKQTIELTAANSWSNSFTNLPKYNNGEEIVYTISERAVDGYITKSIVKDDSTGAYTITNTYKNVTVNKMVLSSTETSTEQAKVDFVLVLDVSGSMVQNTVSDGNGGQITRAEAMVKAANKAITTILSKNTGTTVNNRVGVVMFSKGVTTALTLGDYDAKNTMTGDSTVGEFLKYSEETDWWGDLESATIKTNVTQKTQQISKEVTGGTYTQLGIATGANMLTSASDTTGRTPVMILLTDGKPTYGTTDYGTVTSTSNVGSGSESSGEIGEIGYLTVLSAVKYKNDINNHYKTATNQNVAQMYTIGIGMTGEFNTAVLNPNSTNITACNNSNTNGAQELYDYLTGEEATVKKNTRYDDWSGRLESYEEMELPNPYTNYSYANGSYTGEMDSTKLNQILQDIVNNIDIYTPQLVTTTTNINTDPAKVELVKLDTNKNIIIKLDNVANPEAGSTVAELITAGVVEHDTTNNKYYINLNDDYFASAKTIDITYYETKM